MLQSNLLFIHWFASYFLDSYALWRHLHTFEVEHDDTLWLWRHSLILNVELQRICSLSWLFRVFDATSVGSSSQVNTITYSHLSFYFVVFMQQLFYRPALWSCLYCSLGRNTLLQSNMHHFIFSWYFFCAICKRKRYMILTLSMIMTLI